MKDRLLDLLAQDVSEFFTYICAAADQPKEAFRVANGSWLQEWYDHKQHLKYITYAYQENPKAV